MFRFLLLATITLVGSAVFGQDSHFSGGDIQFIEDSKKSEPYRTDEKLYSLRIYAVHSVPTYRVSTGIQAITYTFDPDNPINGFGFMSSVVPIQLNICISQYGILEWLLDINSNTYTLKKTIQQIWTPAIGLIISKRANESFDIGVSLIPYQFIRDEFSIGIGLQWVNRGKSIEDIRNVSLVLPFTYSLSR